MSESNNNTSRGGLGLCGVVFVVFLVLKLAEIGAVATWSWWWVTAPLWGPFCLVVGGITAFLLVRAVVGPIVAHRERQRRMKRYMQD